MSTTPEEQSGQQVSEEEQAAIARASSRRIDRGPTMGGAVAEKANSFGPSFRRLLKVLSPQRNRLLLVVVFAIISVGLSVIIPKTLGAATDVMIAGVTSGAGIDLSQLSMLLAMAAACAVLSWGSGVGQGWLLASATHESVYAMRTQVNQKLDRLPLSYYDKQPRGELLSRITNDIDNISQTLQQTLQQVLNALLTIIGVLGMMVWVSPILAIISLLIVPVSAVVAMQIGKRSQGRFALMWKHTGTLNAEVEESITGHTLVKTFGRVDEQQAAFDHTNDALYRSSVSAQSLSGIMHPVMYFIGNINYVLIAVIGAYLVINGRLNVGDVQAIFQYSRQFTHPITQVASMANILQSGVASAERVFEILDEEEMTPDGTQPVPFTRGHVEMHGVAFSYRKDEPLIEDLTLIAEPGQTVAIVGPTGAGKTTLVNLLMRFYEIDAGVIEIDGEPIADLPRREHRERFGMVLQDAWIFSGSIRANIAYGRQGATEAEIIEAAEMALADRFIRTLPDGYDTILEDNGANLSAGERQLITIARAFLSQPSILILDEATSNVDTRTEVMIQDAMNRLRSGRTSFVIAHRLSTIRNADVIVVMDHGRIVEIGSHAELMAAQGRYYELQRSALSTN